MPEARHFYEFGPFRLDPAERLLLRNDRPVPLAPKAFDTLLLLVENSGHLLTKDQMMQCLWPGTFVEEVNLAQHISAIRRALGERNDGREYIETVPKAGYRFTSEICKVALEPQPQSKPHTDVGSKWERVSQSNGLFVGGVALFLVLATIVFLVLRDPKFHAKDSSAASSALAIHSLAVLPLVNLSSDPEQEYFSDGMTDALITDLAQFGSLKIISRTSVLRYKKTDKPLPEIARELNVDGIIEGTVQRSGDRVRITAQLIYGPSDRHVWAHSYERETRDTLQLQDTIARDISEEISTNLAGLRGQHPAYSLNLDAYDDYLKGRNYVRRLTRDDTAKGIEFLESSIRRDPNYAPAYAELSFAYQAYPWYIHFPPREVLPKSKAAAIKALSLNENLAEAHIELGRVYGSYEWDWPAAEREFRRAIQLDPNSSLARITYALYLALMGRRTESREEINTALELDPFSPTVHTFASSAFRGTREFDKAILEGRRAVAIDPGSADAHIVLASALGAKGESGEAFTEWLRYLSLDGDVELARELERAAKQISGPVDPGQKLGHITLSYYQQKSKTQYVAALTMAGAYVDLGDKDSVIEWLYKAYEERSPVLCSIANESALDPLRSDPRFQDLLRGMNLPVDSVMAVGIDIRPGSQKNEIELGKDGRVKVAVLSNTTFDAPASVDRTSLTFGKTGDERSLAYCDPYHQDVNGDGLLDLICQFKTQEMGFQLGDTTGVLKGRTTSGALIRGKDTVLIERD